MDKILITGVNGFVGKHLVRELNSRGAKVYGTGLSDNAAPEIANTLESYSKCDLTDPSSVSQLPLDGIIAIVSLAGLASVGASFENPDKYISTNVAVLSVLANRLLGLDCKPRIIAISSGNVYAPDQPMPLTESARLIIDGSPYALSKIKMEEAASDFRRQGLDCVIARPFNHIGPGQEIGFLVPDLYIKIKNSLKTDQPIEVGNLKTRRDYTDVRDVVRAYADLAAAEKLEHNIYNVCSSKSVSGETILNMMLELMGAAGKVKAQANPAYIRPNDPGKIFGNYERLRAETGWQPSIPIEKTLKDFVNEQT